MREKASSNGRVENTVVEQAIFINGDLYGEILRQNSKHCTGRSFRRSTRTLFHLIDMVPASIEYGPVSGWETINLILIDETDNVAVAPADLTSGTQCAVGDQEVTLAEDITRGHKVAITSIQTGDPIIKYGCPIGSATENIRAGACIHTHNLSTDLSGTLEYTFEPHEAKEHHTNTHGRRLPTTFEGYIRDDGTAAIRNEIWIIPTTGCVNGLAERLARKAHSDPKYHDIDGVFALPHPYGCNQLGDDHVRTQQVLADLVHHSHAGAVLVVSLGCETNNLSEFQKILGEWDPRRVEFLNSQDEHDEFCAGLAKIEKLTEHASRYKRTTLPIGKLRIGLTCGGSDAFSGITANPLVGAFTDMFVKAGGSAVLTEVPEMFGAEVELLNRSADRETFDRGVEMINAFKQYFIDRGHPVHENPAPGNIEGGITTLEEKSLGCTKKGGSSTVVDVLPYAGRISKSGLTLLSAPGNDLVCTTALAAAGCHMLLFTTGRGNPLGSLVPTVKISTTSELAAKKKSWIDFDAGPILSGGSIGALSCDLMSLVAEIASGKRTRNEENGYRDMTIL